jgi:polyhydroxyalkanoate synthesis regulator phasin
MADEQERPNPTEQLNEMLINARNELIVQAANLFMLGQKAVHLGLGAAALTKDEVSELLTRMVERGEIAEADIQKNVDVLVERVRARGESTDAELQEFAQKATVVLKENLRTILEQIKLPGGQSVEEVVRQTMGGQSSASAEAAKESATDTPNA